VTHPNVQGSTKMTWANLGKDKRLADAQHMPEVKGNVDIHIPPMRIQYWIQMSSSVYTLLKTGRIKSWLVKDDSKVHVNATKLTVWKGFS